MITSEELEILRKPEVQEYIREKMGLWESGDLFFEPSNEELGIYHSDVTKYLVEVTEIWRIPDCISRDSERPERGIVGMLAGRDKVVRLHINDRSTCVEITWTSYDLQRIWRADTPRLALLKALEWQIGRKP